MRGRDALEMDCLGGCIHGHVIQARYMRNTFKEDRVERVCAYACVCVRICVCVCVLDEEGEGKKQVRVGVIRPLDQSMLPVTRNVHIPGSH